LPFANDHGINFQSGEQAGDEMLIAFTAEQFQVLYTCFNVGVPCSADFASHVYPITEAVVSSVHDKLEAAVADGQLAVDLTDEEREAAWMCFDVGPDLLAVKSDDFEVDHAIYRQINAKLHG
jgi:hypothetical protein